MLVSLASLCLVALSDSLLLPSIFPSPQGPDKLSPLCSEHTRDVPLSVDGGDFSKDELLGMLRCSLGLPADTITRLDKLSDLVTEWNARINLISRSPPPTPLHVLSRHIAPSVSLLSLGEGSPLAIEPRKDGRRLRIADVGTGGGFPGLPLAISMRETADFTLIDSVGKKLTAVRDMAERTGCDNVSVYHGRADEIKRKAFDVILGRSVADLPSFCKWTQGLLKEDGVVIYIKGGNFTSAELTRPITPLRNVPISSLCGGKFPDFDPNPKSLLVFNYKAVKAMAKMPKPPKSQK